MGIPSYFSYIIKNYPQIIQKFSNNNLKIDNLYLDCNSIIYDLYYKIISDDLSEESTNILIVNLIKNVCSKIDYYIHLIKPSKKLLIAFDGVAPLAKLEQQRSRRYKSAYQNAISKTIYNNLKPDPWNTASITPGTKFMEDLSIYIKNYFNDASKYNLETIINSTSDIYGEGEHKIFEYIRDNSIEHKNETTVIYGLDADLIMLSINHLTICKQIYLFRETPHFVQSINKDIDPNENYLLNIPELSKSILLYMNNDDENIINECIHNNTINNKIHDYIFLSFFLGNDFLPHFPALNIRTGGMDKLLNAYKDTIGKTNECLFDGQKINWNNVRKLIIILASMEESFLVDEYKLRNKKENFYYETNTPEQVFKKFESLPTYEREMEKYINPFKENWQHRYYDCLFHIKSDTGKFRKKQICINYLEGLEWTMKYYTTGCVNWRWNYRYHYPPLLNDLLNCIPVFDTNLVSIEKPNPVSPIVQLCYVLPYSSLHLLPQQLTKKLLELHPEWYKNDCEFIWCFCRYFWESHVKMNYIDLKELEEIVEMYNKN
jgi:5'-3' exonuclease